MLKRHPQIKLFALLLLLGCGETSAPPEDAPAGDGAPVGAVYKDHSLDRILLLDQCGGDSWTPFGGCLINGPVARPEWLAEVIATGSHPLWENQPVEAKVESGTTVEVVNLGGRAHSFTRVENFGGGILPALNTREDTRIPAPECLSGIVQIRGAGGSISHNFTGKGEQRYQCCFHPWMRTTVKVKNGE
jgi:plastocyanin